jgi:hypothetical protein
MKYNPFIGLLIKARLQPAGSEQPMLPAPDFSATAVTDTGATLLFSGGNAPAATKFMLTLNGVSKGAALSPYALSGLVPETLHQASLYSALAGYRDSQPVALSFTTPATGVTPPDPDPVYVGAKFGAMYDSYGSSPYFNFDPVALQVGFTFAIDTIPGRTTAVNPNNNGLKSVVENIVDFLQANPGLKGFVLATGINDAWYKTPIGAVNSGDITTFNGAMNAIIDAIAAYPTPLDVFFVTAMQTSRGAHDNSVPNEQKIAYQKTYVDAQIAKYESAGYKKIDVFNHPLTDIGKIKINTADDVHFGTTIGRAVYAAIVANSITPAKAPIIKKAELISPDTLALTFGSSLQTLADSELILLKNGARVALTSVTGVEGGRQSSIPQSIYYLKLAAPVATSDVLTLSISGQASADYLGNSVANVTYPIANDLTQKGRIFTALNASRHINTTFNEATLETVVASENPTTGGATCDFMVGPGDFEIYMDDDYPVEGNVMLAVSTDPLAAPTSGNIFDPANYATYFNKVTTRVFEKGSTKYEKDSAGLPRIKRTGNAITYTANGKTLVLNSPSAPSAGPLYVLVMFYQTTGSARVFVKSDNFQNA